MPFVMVAVGAELNCNVQVRPLKEVRQEWMMSRNEIPTGTGPFHACKLKVFNNKRFENAGWWSKNRGKWPRVRAIRVIGKNCRVAIENRCSRPYVTLSFFSISCSLFTKCHL